MSWDLGSVMWVRMRRGWLWFPLVSLFCDRELWAKRGCGHTGLPLSRGGEQFGRLLTYRRDFQMCVQAISLRYGQPLQITAMTEGS